MNYLQSFPVPGKLYFKQGCLPVALRELVTVYHANRVLILTDEEMLHNERLAILTNTLHELGLEYAVNHESFAADAVVIYTAFADQKQWNAVSKHVPRILITASIISIADKNWRFADMMILDEDLITDTIPAETIRTQTLKTAYGALTGANASDYTLAWAVQAMRLIFSGNDSKTSLLHAFSLAILAMLAAQGENAPSDSSLFPEAANALGMTADELHAKLQQYL